MDQLGSGYPEQEYKTYYMPSPLGDRRKFQPRVAITAFLVAVLGMLLVSGLARGSGADPTIKNGFASPECTMGGCPLTLTSNDSGKSVNYPIGTRFTVMTDGAIANTSLTCSPSGAIAELAWSDPASTFAPTLRYETKDRGTCIIKHGSMQIVVNVSRFR